VPQLRPRERKWTPQRVTSVTWNRAQASGSQSVRLQALKIPRPLLSPFKRPLSHKLNLQQRFKPFFLWPVTDARVHTMFPLHTSGRKSKVPHPPAPLSAPHKPQFMAVESGTRGGNSTHDDLGPFTADAHRRQDVPSPPGAQPLPLPKTFQKSFPVD
jgi:hypothetical protein